MSTTFDPGAIERHGWRQGSVIGPVLLQAARKHAPNGLLVAESDWLIVTSHDCDIVNERIDKEPVVEILRAEVVNRKSPDKQQVWGRNPRTMQLQVASHNGPVVLSVRVHDRWTLPRDLLASEAPACVLGDKERRLIAEWLAKRYIRAAFPTAFDARWRSNLREWTSLLEKHSQWAQGVYIRLNTLKELDGTTPYKIHLFVAVPAHLRKQEDWPAKQDKLSRDVEVFWKQFAPRIEFVDVEVLGTDEITLADIEDHQRFDADWVSFADDSAITPVVADMPM